MLSSLEVWALPAGGGAPSLYRTLQAYSQRGHHVTYVAPALGANATLAPGGLRATRPRAGPGLPGLTVERFSVPSLQTLPLPALLAKLDQKLRFALLMPVLAARRAGRLLEHERFDLLYGYEVHGVLAAARVRRRHRLPLVARFQGTVMHPHLASRLALWRRYEEVAALRSDADLYIMTDDGTQGDEVLRRLNPGSGDRMRFWRNGLDLERLRPSTRDERTALRRQLDLPPVAFVMLTASRLARWKRVDRAIAALPRVLRAVPDACLVIVGDGEERAHLEQQASDLRVSGSVRFVGAVTHESVPDYMRAADLLLAVADLSNVGNPLLEAMTCGLPVVAVDAGDTGELVRNGETGMLLPSASPVAIADAVIAVARQDELREQLGANARRHAENHFWSWDARLKTELEEVEGLVGKYAGQPARAALR
jgi:glycosyltransferase involved in cell wall biosynthesis